jgi:hypothetical protein
MTTSLKQAETDAAAARGDVDRAEQEIASGSKRVTATALHKLRDAFRHADLSAQAARKQAELDRRAVRMTGLEKIGAEVDRLVASDETAEMTAALRDVAAACARFRALAAAHDEAVAELVAAAQDLGAEPPAPGGPRATSAYVAVARNAIVHRRTKVSPLGSCATALAKAMEGDVDAALAELKVAVQQREPKRPDYLLRGGSGQLIAITGELDPAMAARIRDPNGDVKQLSEQEIDLYLAGTLR